jgi:hypothetical protein
MIVRNHSFMKDSRSKDFILLSILSSLSLSLSLPPPPYTPQRWWCGSAVAVVTMLMMVVVTLVVALTCSVQRNSRRQHDGANMHMRRVKEPAPSRKYADSQRKRSYY